MQKNIYFTMFSSIIIISSSSTLQFIVKIDI